MPPIERPPGDLNVARLHVAQSAFFNSKRDKPMNRQIWSATLAALLAACSKAPDTASAPPPKASAPASHATAGVAWVKPDGASLDAVFARAKTENKPVFLYWGAVWCPPCNQIKATVFPRPDFIERSRSFIPVYLDGDTPGAQKLGTQFKVRGYPTTILFSPEGTELTRLPGEVDARQFMQVLQLGMNATQPIKQTLAAATSDQAGAVSAEGWRMLAYYAWDTDESQLLPKKEATATVEKLAQACPAQHAGVRARLGVRAVALAGQNQQALTDKPQALAALRSVLGDATLTHDNADLLTNYARELVSTLTAAGGPDRAELHSALLAALERIASDQQLSNLDRLGAVQAKVDLAQMDQPDGSKPHVPPELVAQVKQLAAQMDQSITDKYERQSVMPNVAHLLTAVGELDASDALMQAELPKAVSAYYHMLVLASTAKARGDKVAALDWAEKAYAGSLGPATRLQWGSGFVNKLIEMAPQDPARIEKVASQVIGELDPAPETFYERNRRSLEKMGLQLQAWGKANKQGAVVARLVKQLDAVCAKLPEGDEARVACKGALVPKATKT